MQHFTVEEFTRRVNVVKQVIQDNICQTLNEEYHGKYEYTRQDVFIDDYYYYNDEKININRDEIISVSLEDSTPEVYQVEKRANDSLGKKSVTVNIIFHLTGVTKYDKDVFNLGEERKVFYTFEDFLQFAHDNTLDICLSDSHDKKRMFFIYFRERTSKVYLFNLFNRDNPLRKDLPPIYPWQLTTLERYKGLDKEVKKQVDKVLCPFIIGKDDVESWNGLNHAIVHVDNEEMVKEYTQVHIWDILFNEVFSS